ncbi:hypothetical protein HPB50_002182 [Hyalomma asiaticum]|uniref:Uncharacterized protein n=1 Tax=Hyalomma asiaticum TaxID=266040 RepID=A0ACB7RJS2_HYAAI|nr:hypothetical protein HPB50_002182 [Hyalomma asiaticum]
MPDLAGVYRLSNHAIAGVNWRPTRFVEAVPRSYVCSLCSVIPKRTVLLPCSHVLCDSCHSANSHGYGGQCPLDLRRFEKRECSLYSNPTLSYLQAYCWNEAHGCEFQGTVEEILRHYDSACKFHAVECSRCGEAIPRSELSRHYVSGCSAHVSSARAADTSVEQKALTLQDVRPAFEELKALMRDANHEHLLLAIQSRINELTEEVRNHESRPPTITRGVAASANAEASQVAYSPTPSSVSQERAVRPTPTEEVGPSSSSSRQELFSMLSPAVLQQMRKTSTQDYPQHAIAHCGPNIACDLTLLRPLSTTRTWREQNGTVKYVLTLENLAKDMLLQERVMKIAEVTVLHTMDAYFSGRSV